MKKKLISDGARRLLGKYGSNVVWISCLTVLQSILLVVSAVLMRFVINGALLADGTLPFWGAAMIADLTALVGVHTLLSWYAGSTVDKFTARLRYELLESAAYSQDVRLHAYHSGELLSRGMEDVHTVCDGVMNALPMMVGQTTQLIATFAAVLFIYPPIAGILTVAAVIVGCMAAWMRPLMKRRHRLVRVAEEKMLADMQEDLQQLELIQSLQTQEQSLLRFEKRLRNTLSAKFKRRLVSVASNSVINIVSQLGTGALLLWGAVQVAAGTLSYGSLTSMLQLLSLFRSPVLGLSGLWTRMTAVEVASERLLELLTVQKTEEAAAETGITVKAVVFENVTFGYPGEDAPVLRQFNARFSLDGWACLTGISGKGKTTLFKLILGLYRPQEGRVYLDTDQGEILCSEQTRYLFAYVPQDYALFSGTVLENLQMVAPDADEKCREAALKAAQADFVWEMTSGEQTQVRENNTGLSKGQLQRLAIARALLMDRQILLLDECTSALDARTEEGVLRALQASGKCAILVTHRPAALDGLEKVTFVAMDGE